MPGVNGKEEEKREKRGNNQLEQLSDDDDDVSTDCPSDQERVIEGISAISKYHSVGVACLLCIALATMTRTL